MKRFAEYLDRIDIGGWALLASGLLLIALTYLTPAYLVNQSLANQRRTLTQQAQQIEQRLARYEQFVQACQRCDPQLIQRIAWHLLGLKPKGSTPLDDRLPSEPGVTLSLTELIEPDSGGPIDSPATVAVLPNTRLTRWTTGKHSYIMLAIGSALCAMGLIMSIRPSRDID